jgi:THO complex subunit 2
MVNPARAALINDTREPPTRPSPRESLRERPPRTESPRRSDRTPADAPPPDNPRDDRHGRHRHSPRPETPRDVRDAHRETAAPSSRPDRVAERDDRKAGPRDSYSGQSRPDHEHGRLNQQDPNYGRLNPIQSVVDMPVGAPSGPRGRGGRSAGRTGPANGPPMRPDNRFPALEPIRPPTPERHPPTGPSASRSRRGQYDNASVNSPTSAAPPSVGVHPDRVRQINQVPAPPPPPPPPTAPSGSSGPSGVHPDRLNQIAAQPPGHGSQARPPMHTPDRPSMPAPNLATRSAPSGPSADFSSAPTGPAAAGDRMRPGGRQLRGIQNMLDKASADSARGPSLRMSRSRPNLAGSDAQILVGASPVGTPVHERPVEPFRDSSRRESTDRTPRGAEPIQVASDSRDVRDVRDSRDTSNRGPMNGDDYGSSRTEHERSRREHHRSERSTRASGRSSRERTPDRERGDAKDPRDHRDRDRRSSNVPGSSTRDERDTRRSMRESTGGGREPIPGGGRDLAPPRESSSHRGHRGEGPSGPRGDGPPGGGRGDGGRGEDYGRSGTSRGNAPPRESRSTRPGDERGDPRGDERARKRRSEGVDAGGGSHQDKRQRR